MESFVSKLGAGGWNIFCGKGSSAEITASGEGEERYLFG